MRTGTKSLLWGVHQFAWHPFIVWRAWRALYGKDPTWREFICIVVHDWGYVSCRQMDDERGEEHPFLGAEIVRRLFGMGGGYWSLVAYHSRHLARRDRLEPSRLCWPDKLSVLYDPPWFYLFRARLSGELAEYRVRAAEAGVVPPEASDREWFRVLCERFEKSAKERRADIVLKSNGRTLDVRKGPR